MQRMRRFGLLPALWLVALILLLVVSSRYSLGIALRTGAPATAVRLAPNDARVLAAMASATLRSPMPTAEARARAARQATAALMLEPGNVSAVTTLGLVAALDGQRNKAKALFDYSVRRSRRELQAQLWLIEDAVGRQDIPAALSHYDVALRTSKSAPDILFPVLTQATSDAQIRSALIGVLRKDPIWREAFEGYLANHTRDYPAAIALFAAMARSGVPPIESGENVLLSNMVTAGLTDDAWRYYRLRRPRIDPVQPRNATFSPNGADGSPFAWGLINDNGISSSLGGDASGGALSFEVSPSIGGTIIQQMQHLPPGRYRLSGHSRIMQHDAADHLRWEIVCGDGRPLGRASLRSLEREPVVFATSFIVPPVNCGFQLLRLSALPTDNIEGISGEMLNIHIQRESGA